MIRERVWRPSRDDILMENVVSWAKRTTCGRSQRAGAVISMDGRVISTGYAGPPRKLPHCLEGICDPSQPCTRTVHAELNAILNAARHGIAIDGTELHCTLSPCVPCAQAIINTGIIKVVYGTSYRLPDGIRLLERAGIPALRYVPAEEPEKEGRLVFDPHPPATP